jgi:general secretion pathway protein J
MSRRPATTACPGFTLLELLVALAIFGLLATMSYSGLRVILEQQSGTAVEAERLAELQKIYMLMQRDIEQAVDRPVRDEYGDEQPALVGADTLQLTRGGWSNPAARTRSSLQRVGYVFEDDQLVRYAWAVLDRAQDSEPLRQPLTASVEQLQLRYLAANNEWRGQWPDTLQNADPAAPAQALPRAVEVTLEHAHYGQLVWLFRLPQ